MDVPHGFDGGASGLRVERVDPEAFNRAKVADVAEGSDGEVIGAPAPPELMDRYRLEVV